MENAVEKIIEGLIELGFKLIGLILIITIGLKLVKVIINFLKKINGYGKLDKSVQTFLISLANIVLKALVFITALAYVGIPMTSILTVFGTATLAVGLSLQGGLTNMMGGIMILIFKPFSVGDYIETADGSGTVDAITIFYTVLKTPDNKKVVMPNGPLSNETVTNYSSQTKRRLDIDFSVNHNTDVEKVKKILMDIITEEELVLKDEDLFARLSNHTATHLTFTTRVWTKTEDYWTVKFNILEKVKKEFDKNNIKIPFQKLDVHMEK